MRPTRSRLDWSLEAIALGALLLLLYLLAANWENLPLRPTRVRFPGAPEPWSVRTALGFMGALGVVGYVGMTLATNYEKLVHIPEPLERAAPHLRQMIFSMGILLKTVLMAVSLYLVWVLVNFAQGRIVGFGRRYITGLVLLVLAPFALYVVKLRRHR
jgi:hypothetical protein